MSHDGHDMSAHVFASFASVVYKGSARQPRYMRHTEGTACGDADGAVVGPAVWHVASHTVSGAAPAVPGGTGVHL